MNMGIIHEIHLLLLTSTEFPAEANTGVIVTLTVRSVDTAKAGWVTHTLTAITLPLTTAYVRLIVCNAVAQQCTLLITFTLRSQEPRLTHAHATMESPLAVDALAAVCHRRLMAVT